MVAYLQDALGAEYDVLNPKMPDPESLQYEPWKIQLAHLAHYEEKLPQATVRALDGNEHAFNDGLPELVDDIKSL